ncbi:MAG: hypothetical protein M1829_006256 [Trizodia sp. TS-e1964]|nr:MAG: hypothetical protein M1829_006256 [Trizodia sp. TS-e1964]
MDLPSSPKEISARGSLDKNPKDEDPGPCMRPRSPFNIPFPLLPVESNTNSAINSIDIGVAKGLLSDSTNSIAQNLSSNTSPVRGRSNTSFWGLDGSSLSCPDRSAIVPSVSSCQVTKDGHDFVHEYDLLANQHCLPNFGSEPSIPHDFLESSLAKSANWLMKKVFRQASPTHTNGDKNMTKQKSLGEISRLYRSKKDSLEGICLDDIVRLGGCTTLILPSEFSISALSIPPCIGASAVFIAEQGIKAAGIFRIPGQSSIVKQLYEYYAHQFQQADALGDNIQQAVSYSQLPGHIPFTIHDVASTFKKVLSGLPGGIIGSVALLEALYSILYNLVVDEVVSNMPVYQVKARLIALAILAQGSENRFALINTVIGLLAMIGREAERANSRRASEASSVQDSDKIQKSPSKSITVAHPGMTTSDLMTYHALGVVFGPLLAGDLIGQFKIPTANEEDSTGDPTFASEGTRRGKKKSKNGIDEEDSQQDLLLELKKVKILSEMAEMLVKSWEEVVRQMAIVKRVDRPVGLGLGMGILGTSPKHAIRRPVKARINENAESSTSSSGMQGQTLSYTPLPSARASSEKPLSDMIDEALLSPRKASSKNPLHL